ncbi:MAG: DUF1329 domain-containing protein [Thermoanaerobaculia bacterium]|nr:MAG: DUF1329 domain-containing protein [Thermoanaerobaculia bacterium]
MRTPTTRLFLSIWIVVAVGAAFAAGLSPQDAARLGQDLTPLGAEKGASADGTIPAWTGGITQPPAGYQPGKHYVDPFAADAVVATIDGKNMATYSAKLSEGHKAMLAAYPSFRMKVYPTRRSASVPARIYEATARTATTAQLAPGGNGVTGALAGVPFPIPKSGVEVIWNHLLRFRGEIVHRQIAQAAPTRGGQYTLVQFEEETMVLYHQQGMTEAELRNRILLFKQEVTSPARLAGGILLVHETLNQVNQPRDAWLYNPGQRRVRRAPQVAYDNPGTASDNMRTSDQLDMFNGAPDRYDWQLVGKKEIYVPYNSYRLQDPQLKYKDILTPLHINPEHLRYELHRVWVVDATLKPQERHIYKRRTFYVDEDSWQILLVDQYDNRDQLWRVSEGHVMNFYNVPTTWTAAEVHTDLQAGRYLVMGLFGESAAHDFGIQRTEADFTPDALRREGVR